MRFLHALTLVIVGATWFLTTGAAPISTPLKNGLIFSGLKACPQHGHLTFQVSAGNGLPPDTLCSNVVTGELLWNGGPIRGLCTQGDTAHAATLLGFYSITPDTTLFTPWKSPLGGALPHWQANPACQASQRLDSEQPFPERYLEQQDGTLVFLVDGEHSPSFDRRWHDLHLRSQDGTEWLGARNLAVHNWVLSADKIHWALAARAWIPDYGGQEKFILLAGAGKRVERFETGPLEYCAWDSANTLWAVTEEGRLIRIQPGENAWTSTTVELAQHRCGTQPSHSDSIWTWVWPDPLPTYNAARSVAGRHRQGWVAQHDHAFWACWTGFRNLPDLERSWPEPPLEGSVSQPMSIVGSNFLGTARHFRSKELHGEASLMHVMKKEMRLSELWWRYTGKTAVRLAGPWTVETQTHD